MKKVLEKLKKMQDKKYGEFQAKLIPTIDRKTIIGVRTPELKAFAKEMLKGSQSFTPTRGSQCFALTQGSQSMGTMKGSQSMGTMKGSRSMGPMNGFTNDVEIFLDELPHKYFDENQLHVFILSEMKDFDICIKRVNEFLPYVNNWATCDQLSPKCFKMNKEVLLKHINKWIKSKKPYFIRFAIEMLMSHFLDADFDEKYLKMVSDVKFASRVTRQKKKLQSINSKTNRSDSEKISVDINPDKYYVEMMRAWYFATALAKQYDATLPYIKNGTLEEWTHNKTIQKACESFRVCETHKKELKKYKK